MTGRRANAIDSVRGPDALGRGVVVGAHDAVPAAWAAATEMPVTDDDVARRTATVDRLHHAWVERQPVVVRLLADPAGMRQPRRWTAPLWELGGRFDPWTDRLQFLVWNNNYDARAGRSPRWWWAAHASTRGATDTDGRGAAADVILPDGTPAWIDGGPRQAWPEGSIAGSAVVHYLSVRSGRLRADRTGAVARSSGLAPDQLAAVSHIGGPARIIAPAGSGKTRVLTERLRHLVADRGIERDQVLALAYNKRAQIEMENRCSDFSPRIQTLNALGFEILREAIPGIAMITREREIRALVERHCPQPERRALNSDPVQPYLEALSLARQALLAPSAVEHRLGEAVPGFARVLAGYRGDLIAAGQADFDEQIYRSCEVLLADPALRARWQSRCRHLLVDEFQDVTPLHLLLLRILASPALDVTAVGDDDQVLNAYAGADPSFLIEYASLFPGAASHALTVNYRCPVAVVRGASRLLSHNRRRVAKRIRPARECVTGAARLRVVHHRVEDSAAQLQAVVQGWLEEGAAPDQIAVLSRVNAGLLSPQVMLAEAGIPVVAAVGAETLQRTGVRSAFAWLRCSLNPQQVATADLEEVIRRPSRGFSREFVVATLQRRSTWSHAELRRLAAALVGRDRARLLALLGDLRAIHTAAAGARGSTVAAIVAVRRAGLDAAMTQLDASGTGADASHIDDLDALSALAALQPNAAEFEMWLRGTLGRQRAGTGGVTLATIHRVKGQEWPYVAICDVRDGLLPHRRASDIEEERRILHVGITRASRAAVILAERARRSPFIAELTTPRAAATSEAGPQTVAGGSGTGPNADRGRRPRVSTNPRPVVVACEGLAVEAAGGHSGTICSVVPTGAYVALAGGGRLFIRYGERVRHAGAMAALSAP